MDQATSDWLLGEDRGWKPRWAKAYEIVSCAMRRKAKFRLQGSGLPSGAEDDVVQEAWIAVVAMDPQSIRNLEAVAVGITSKKAIDALRRAHAPTPEPAPSYEEEAYEQALWDAKVCKIVMEDLLYTELDERERRLFIAHVSKGVPCCRLNKQEGITAQRVGQIVAGATRKLNRALKRRLEEEEGEGES